MGGSKAKAAGYSRSWYDTAQFGPNDCAGQVGKTCDEFPFWTTSQAVNLSGTTASVKPVPIIESSPQGSDISAFTRKCEVADEDNFIVLPIDPWVEAGGPSFGFRVDEDGTTVCMKPELRN
jgi:hypothetical protein